jgi:RimJ/RimL family protein N-acetyltransferase
MVWPVGVRQLREERFWPVGDRRQAKRRSHRRLRDHAAVNPNGREPEIGYHLWRDFWGCGFASEAARATLQFGMQTLQMRRIVSIVAERNIPSQRVAGAIHQRMEQFTTHDKASGFDGEYRLYITERAGS